jgi:hypothetical protein
MPHAVAASHQVEDDQVVSIKALVDYEESMVCRLSVC